MLTGYVKFERGSREITAQLDSEEGLMIFEAKVVFWAEEGDFEMVDFTDHGLFSYLGRELNDEGNQLLAEQIACFLTTETNSKDQWSTAKGLADRAVKRFPEIPML